MMQVNSTADIVNSAHNHIKDTLEIHDLQSFLDDHFSDIMFSRKCPFYLIFWVQEGAGTYRVDLKEYTIRNDTVYCLYPGQLSLFTSNFYLKGYALSFTLDFLCSLRDDMNLLINNGLFNLNNITTIDIRDDIPEMEQLLQSMNKECAGKSAMRDEILRALLKVFLIRLTRKKIRSVKDNQKINDPLVNNFLELVHNNFMKVKKVSDYAEMLCVAPNYMNVRIKSLTGFTASYHIQQRIVLEAKRKARWEGASLKEIAYLLGFDNISHFSKFFKKGTGISFSEFKKMQLEEV